MANTKDFATALIATAPNPSTTGTTLVLSSGMGSRMPLVPFSAVVHPEGQMPTLDNSERVMVTALSIDTLTIVRARGGTSAKSIGAGWRLSNAIFSDEITPSNGWSSFPNNVVLSYASYSSATRTGVLSTNLDMSQYISLGMRVMIYQDSTKKYAIVTSISSTSITLFFNSDYALSSSTIAYSWYSNVKVPYGFDINPAKWSILYTNTTQLVKTSAASNSWTYMSPATIVLPVGLWYPVIDLYVVYYAMAAPVTWQELRVAMSTSNSTVSDTGLMVAIEQGAPSAQSNEVGAIISITPHTSLINLSADTTYYAIAYPSNSAGTTGNIIFYGDRHTTKLGGVCAYL